MTSDLMATGELLLSLIKPMWILCLYLFAQSIYNSLRSHRTESTATWSALAATLLTCVGDLVLIPYYYFFGQEEPILEYLQSSQNQFIIDRCPSLKSFHPTCWLQNPFISFGVMLARELLWPDYYHREVLRAPDGGNVALDWFKHSKADRNAMDETTPIMFCVSTLAGDPMCYPNGKTCYEFAKRGYRVACYVKRGCGIYRPNRFVTPKMWCLSDYEDLTMCVDYIADKYPRAPIVAVGYSTGGGQLRNYIARTGVASKIAAGVVVDAGWQWDECVTSLDERIPFLSYCLSQSVLQPYLQYVQKMPETVTEVGVEISKLRRIRSMGNMIGWAMAPSNGFRGKALEYMHSSLPGDINSVAVPMLNLATLNDMVISRENLLSNSRFFTANKNIISVVNKRGTHVIRWEGILAQKCWISQASIEFCTAVLKYNEISRPHSRMGSRASSTRVSSVLRCKGVSRASSPKTSASSSVLLSSSSEELSMDEDGRLSLGEIKEGLK
ncbi:hypothetical protein AAMO2058_000744600 [Amorphochlora amoebiformis]